MGCLSLNQQIIIMLYSPWQDFMYDSSANWRNTFTFAQDWVQRSLGDDRQTNRQIILDRYKQTETQTCRQTKPTERK